MYELCIRIGIVFVVNTIIAFVCGYTFAAETYKQKLRKAKNLLKHYIKFI